MGYVQRIGASQIERSFKETSWMAFIEIKNLFKRFKKVVAVNHIQLEVKEGEMLTLLGPSGCGKTTTLRCIAGLERPEEGDIVIDGKPMLSQGFVEPSKRGIGMVFQNYAVWPHMKVYNNIVYGLKIQKMSRQQMNEKAQKVLELVGLSGLEDRYPAQLSGGQQQRVALARCLANDPDVILMDEPLGALDALTREKMQSLVLRLWKETGKTIILITHSVEEALLLGERLLVMAPRPGRIHTEYRLPFAEMGVDADLREVKKHPEFGEKREEILTMIWDMEEEIMGRTESAA